MNEKILIVDDEREIADLVEVYLQNEGFQVCKFYNAGDALGCLDGEEISLAILDVMLPDMDGFALCRKIREKHLFPIIMLTAKVEDMDKITGLTLGADDYITKPFGMIELISRIRAVLRRYEKTQTNKIYKTGGLYVNPAKHIIEVMGESVALSYKEYSLLMVLLEAEGNVVEREKLLAKVWGEFYTESRTLDVHIRKLRVKLGAAGNLIQTIKGIGYKIGGVENE